MEEWISLVTNCWKESPSSQEHHNQHTVFSVRKVFEEANTEYLQNDSRLKLDRLELIEKDHPERDFFRILNEVPQVHPIFHMVRILSPEDSLFKEVNKFVSKGAPVRFIPEMVRKWELDKAIKDRPTTIFLCHVLVHFFYLVDHH